VFEFILIRIDYYNIMQYYGFTIFLH